MPLRHVLQKNSRSSKLAILAENKRSQMKAEMFTHLIRAGAMSLNQVVPNVTNLKIGWFHSIKSQKTSGFIAPFSKIEWFHGTTGAITKASPGLSADLV